MDKRIDLTLNGDFRKSRGYRHPKHEFDAPTEGEILCGFATGSLDEIKYKKRIIHIHHTTEGDKPECLRCGRRIFGSESMTCRRCDDEFYNEKMDSEMSYYFANKIKNKDREFDLIKQLFK